MSKVIRKQDVMARILDGDILASFENIIIDDRTSVEEEILEQYRIPRSPLLNDMISLIKVRSALRGEDYADMLERLIIDELISNESIASAEDIVTWFEQEG